MRAETLDCGFLVLDRSPAAEPWMRLTVFSSSEGLLHCLQRVSSRPTAPAPPLDLFDEVRATLETRNQGRTWFIREAAVQRRRSGLGASYAVLAHACRFSRVLARTPVHQDSRLNVHALLHRALDAWETGLRPDAVYFKCLFLLARDEGFPVREAWLDTLPDSARATASSILSRPTADQVASEAATADLTRRLEEELQRNHDFVFPVP